VIIKAPACYDVSHWKEIPDFQAVNPRPALFITKATEGYPGSGHNHTDDKFFRFMEGFQSIGCMRGAYHFFRRHVDAKRQAEHFLSVISKLDILPTDLLILDVEEGGETAAQLWIWFETVRRACPANPLILYGRKNLLDPIPMTEGEKAYFRKIPTWLAGYPYFPDMFSSIPKGYTPDQSKYGEPWLWQYSAHGKVEGIVGDVDLNWIHPTLLAILATNTIGEIMTINAVGKCADSSNKVWSAIGGRQIGAFRLEEVVRIDQEQTVSGVKYIHATNGALTGWSKAQWFSYAPAPAPAPQPEPEPVEEYVLHVKDGVARKFIPE